MDISKILSHKLKNWLFKKKNLRSLSWHKTPASEILEYKNCMKRGSWNMVSHNFQNLFNLLCHYLSIILLSSMLETIRSCCL